MIGTRLNTAALLGAAAICLVSCATLRRFADRGVIRSLERHLAAGRGDELARMSQVPFLLDGEVVVLPEDVLAFWTAVASADWSFEGTELAAGAAVDERSYQRFADSQEVAAFFRNYVGPSSRLIDLVTPEGARVLVLVQEKPFSRRLLGFSTKPDRGAP